MNKRKIKGMIRLGTILMMMSMIITRVFAMEHYYEVDFKTGIVTAAGLNVRSGPGTNYKVITTVSKNEYVRVFAGIGKWYVIQTDDNYIGVASSKYIKAIYANNKQTNNTNVNINIQTNSLTKDEKEVFDLINQKRIANGLQALVIDMEVVRVARIKAQDLVDNNYFSHTSPTYGSPFEMLSSFKVTYRSAGENLAGNSSNAGAVEAWMNSEGHRANILNSSYDYTGIGVVNSPIYGKMYVKMFIGK